VASLRELTGEPCTRPVALGTQSRLNTMKRAFAGDSGESRARCHPKGTGGNDASASDRRPPISGVLPPAHRPLPGYDWELPEPGAALTACFNRVRTRLHDSARQRGGHGVVDIRVDVAGEDLIQGNMEISLTGTAIRHTTAPGPKEPFTAGISCQAFSKLIAFGLVPVQLAMGAAVLSSWVACQSGSELESGRSNTIEQLGDLVTQAREAAVARMWEGTELCGAPFFDVAIRHAHGKASKTDHRASAWATGTVALRFDAAAASDLATVVVLLEQR
jgi:uncharacterized protein YbjQ (UPF0145 family)